MKTWALQRKLYSIAMISWHIELDEPDMQDTAGEAGTNS